MKKHRIGKAFFLLGILLFAATGCSGTGKTEEEKQQKEEETLVVDEDLYILLNCNQETNKVFLENYQTGLQNTFVCNENTTVTDRSGEETTVESLPIGELVKISYTQEEELISAAVSSDTFCQTDVMDYSADPETYSIVVEGTTYSYNEMTRIFSDSGVIPLSVLMEREEGDSITVRGCGDEVVTIVLNRQNESEK